MKRTYTPAGVIGVQVDDYTRYTWVRQKHGTVKITSATDKSESYFWYLGQWQNTNTYVLR